MDNEHLKLKKRINCLQTTNYRDTALSKSQKYINVAIPRNHKWAGYLRLFIRNRQ